MIVQVQHNTITPEVDQEGFQKALRSIRVRVSQVDAQTNTKNFFQVLQEHNWHEVVGGGDPPIPNG